MSFESKKIYGEMNSSDREQVEEAFDVWRQEEKEKMIPGEIEKSPDTMIFIEKANEYINQEFESLGLDFTAIDPDTIHVVPEKVLQNEFSNVEANGVYRSLSGGIYIKENHRLQMYKSLLHEMVHAASFQSYLVQKSEKVIENRRVGYAAEHPDEQDHNHFRGLNEAVVDRVARDILRHNIRELMSALDITEDEIGDRAVRYYDEYMDVLEVVIEKVSEQKGETEEEVWRRIKQGEFTGEMMHLRDIERVFGKGSLRVLAAMGSGTKDFAGDEANEMVLEYFQTEDSARRDAIAKRVLIERERNRYIKRSSENSA